MDEIKQEAIILKIKKILDNGHFSICDFDTLMDASGGFIDSDTYKKLRLLHCIDYGDMSTQMRRWLAATTMRASGIYEKIEARVQISVRFLNEQ